VLLRVVWAIGRSGSLGRHLPGRARRGWGRSHEGLSGRGPVQFVVHHAANRCFWRRNWVCSSPVPPTSPFCGILPASASHCKSAFSMPSGEFRFPSFSALFSGRWLPHVGLRLRSLRPPAGPVPCWTRHDLAHAVPPSRVPQAGRRQREGEGLNGPYLRQWRQGGGATPCTGLRLRRRSEGRPQR
jgi:hypothetical protein